MVEPSPADAEPHEGYVRPDIEDASAGLMIDVAEAISGGPRVAARAVEAVHEGAGQLPAMSEPVPKPAT